MKITTAFCILLFCSATYILAQNNLRKEVATSISIVTHDFMTHYFVGLTTDKLLRVCNNNQSDICETNSISDKGFIEFATHRIDSLNNKDTLDAENSGVDVRIVCLIYRTNKIDTISFGKNSGLNPPSMIVNNKYYRLDKDLLLSIIPHVSRHRNDIVKYLNEQIPRYEEMLDKYYHEHPNEPDRR